MCEPTTIAIAGLAMSGAASGANYYGQSQAAQAQGKYASKMYSETAKQAMENYSSSLRQIDNRTEQERAKIMDAATSNAIEGMKARGTAAASLGERGLSGNTVEALIQDFDRQEAVNRSSLQTNYEWVTQQAQEEKEGARAQAKSRISGATPPPIQMPSLLAAGLSIAGTTLNTFDTVAYRNKWGGYADANKKS